MKSGVCSDYVGCHCIDVSISMKPDFLIVFEHIWVCKLDFLLFFFLVRLQKAIEFEKSDICCLSEQRPRVFFPHWKSMTSYATQ